MFSGYCARTCRTSLRAAAPLRSFSNTKLTEDAVEDVVCRGCAGDGVEWAERAVEVEQEHLVRDVVFRRPFGGGEGGERFANESFVADVGEKSGLLLRGGIAGDVLEDLLAEFGDAFAGGGGSSD